MNFIAEWKKKWHLCTQDHCCHGVIDCLIKNKLEARIKKSLILLWFITVCSGIVIATMLRTLEIYFLRSCIAIETKLMYIDLIIVKLFLINFVYVCLCELYLPAP